jgi:thiosulfate/3-mercaptopyruvate sulfurtransferase
MLFEKYARAELLIEPEALQKRLGTPNLRLVDVRSQTDYDAGHLPGAVRLDEGLLRTERDKETYLPTPDEVSQIVKSLGVGPKTHVIAYDADFRGAARLWYVLSVHGIGRVSLLQGGIRRWTSEKRPLSVDKPTEVAGGVRVKRPAGSFFCPTTKAISARKGVVLLDTRSPEEYKGEARSKGHVPGAVHVDWRENLEEGGQNFKSQSALRKLYAERGITPDREIVTYCASGGRASVSLFALTLIGYKKVRLYYGSYSDYAARPGSAFER